MVEATETAFGVLVLALSVWFGYRAITAGTLYRSVSATEGDSPSTLVGGEAVAIEGTVNVRDSPPLSGAVPTGEEGSIGAYVWRLKRPDAGNEYNIDLEEGDLSNMDTYASGIESGTFAVDDGRREIRVGVDWVAETHDSTDITAVSLENWQTSTPLSNRTWTSPYVHLAEHRSAQSLAEMDDVFDADAAGESPGSMYFESKAIPDGGTLAVSGEVTVEQGEPVLRGSDETPLVLSDQGFDGLGRNLRRQMLKYGLLSSGLLATAGLLLARGLEVL